MPKSERLPDGLRFASGFGIPFLLVLYLAFASGGYELVSRSQVGIIVWWAVLLGIVVGVLPAARITTAGRIVLAIVGALFVWTLAGTLFWTESTERSVIELSRVATLSGVFLLMILIQGRDGLRYAVAAIAAAVAIVSVIALFDRFEPDLLPFGTDYAFPADYPRARLNYPLEYWNGLAIFVAMGAGPMLWIGATGRTVAGRAAAAGALPLLVLAGYLTASRGGVIEGAAVLVAMLVLFPRRIQLILSMVVPAVGSILLVVLVNKRPELRDLAPGNVTKTQGTQMLWLTLGVFAVCVAIQACALLVAKRFGWKAPRGSRAGAQAAGITAGIATVLVLLLAVSSGFVGDKWSEFKVPTASGTVSRLANVNSGERYLIWKADVDAGKSEPVTGIGPGAFEYFWAREGEGVQFVRDGHSIYLEGFAEMGLLGIILTVALILGPLGIAIALALRRGLDERRGLIAAAGAGMAAFAVGAGIDWAWELTILPVMFFVLTAGVVGVFAQDDEEEPAPTRVAPPSWAVRVPVGIVALAMIALIAVPLAATMAYRSSQESVRSGNLTNALDQATDAVDIQPYSASAKIQVAQVLELLDRDQEAIKLAREATEDETGNWRNWYVLSHLLEMKSKEQSRKAFEKARSLNPKSVLFTIE